MRILFVAHDYPPQGVGGTEVHTEAVANELASHGHDVRVFAGGLGKGSGDRSVMDDRRGAVVVRRVGEPPEVGLLRLRDPWVRLEFERFVEEARPDVVHIQHLLHLSGDLIEAARARSLPSVVTLHDFWFQCPAIHPGARVRHPFSGSAWGVACVWHHALRPRRIASMGMRGMLPAGLIAPLGRAATLRRQLALADLILAPSRFVHDAFLRFGIPGSQLRVIPHGTHVQPVPRARPFTAPVRFGFVGSLLPAKGVHVLCRAFRRLDGNSTLHIYGRVHKTSYLRRIARSFGSRIRYEGEFPPDNAGAVYSTFDVLVVPSLVGESYGLTAVEAQSCGLPVIASRIGALPERVRHGRDGLLVPPGDVRALRRALAYFQDPREVRRFAAEVPAPLPMASYVEALEEIYARVTSGLVAPNLLTGT